MHFWGNPQLSFLLYTVLRGAHMSKRNHARPFFSKHFFAHHNPSSDVWWCRFYRVQIFWYSIFIFTSFMFFSTKERQPIGAYSSVCSCWLSLPPLQPPSTEWRSPTNKVYMYNTTPTHPPAQLRTQKKIDKMMKCMALQIPAPCCCGGCYYS